MQDHNKQAMDPTGQTEHSEGGIPVQAGTGKDGNASTVDVIYKWSQGTSVHGIHYFMDRDNFSVLWRLAWAAFVCCSTVAMLWQVSSLIKNFFSFTVTTSVEIIERNGLIFPDVTVCSTNRYDHRKTVYKDTNFTFYNETTGYNETLVKQIMIEPLNDEELKKMSTPFEELILWPSFEQKLDTDLDVTQWAPVITPYGQCFQFHTEELMISPALIADRGLDFVVHLNQFETFALNALVAGIYVFLHEPGAVITDQDTFYSFQPGSFYFAEIEKREYYREREKPWRTCKGVTPVYSQELCRSNCWHTRVRKDCGCRKIGDPEDYEGLDYCPTGIHLNGCDRLLNPDELLACDCAAAPCDETVYEWKAVSKLDIADDYLRENNIARDDWNRDQMKITINYGSLRKEVVTEAKAQSEWTMHMYINSELCLYCQLSTYLGTSNHSIFAFFQPMPSCSVILV